MSTGESSQTKLIWRPKPARADENRRNRRALVKALGFRQFKKLYRKAQA